MSLVELKQSTVQKLIQKAFHEDFWQVEFDQVGFEKTKEHVWLLNDAKRHGEGEQALVGRLEIPPWIWTHPDPIEQRAVVYRGAKELRAALDSLVSS